MKKTYALSIVSFFILLMTFYACQKQETVPLQNSDQIKNAQDWFKTQKITNYSPEWDKAKIVKNLKTEYMVLKINYPIDPLKNKIESYLVITGSNGSFTGKIIESINSDIKEDQYPILFSYLFEEKINTPNIQGEILSFDINHKFI
ncbi:hypothetical protein [Pedobacter gandavensis]|uniref:hypothetical protein n=1 Tax=Pedobacter gandavensis TaxID=2679963 RepID=UPI0029316270|nr:hypothetical protein [Pedobacter gandavensis]